MAKKDRDETAVDRIEDRLERTELRRVAMPDGGEVYRGAVANRALEALGARAFTVDRTIVVGEDFDPYRAEDAALYAHEMYHVEAGDGGGGGGGENYRDAEEIAARAVESLVLSRMAIGGVEAGYAAGAGARKGNLQDGNSGAGIGARPGDAGSAPEDTNGDPTPEKGYEAMVSQGMEHRDIVDQLTRRVLRTLDEQVESRNSRQGNNKGFA